MPPLWAPCTTLCVYMLPHRPNPRRPDTQLRAHRDGQPGSDFWRTVGRRRPADAADAIRPDSRQGRLTSRMPRRNALPSGPEPRGGRHFDPLFPVESWLRRDGGSARAPPGLSSVATCGGARPTPATEAARAPLRGRTIPRPAARRSARSRRDALHLPRTRVSLRR